MSQNLPVPRVKGGLPLWLWGMLLVASVAVVTGLIVSVVPEDPALTYEEALQQLNGGSKENFQRSLGQLKQYPEYADHVTLLKGIQAAQESRDPKAIEFFEQVRTNAELKPLALQKIGESLTRMGNFREAIDRFEEAISAAPETADQSRLLLARLYQVVGALTLAESTLTEIIAVGDVHIEAHRMRGQLRASLFRFAEAVEDYSGTLATPGDVAAASPDAIGQYAICLLKLGNTEKLAEFTKQNMNLLSENSLKARLLFEAGDLEGARTIVSGAPPDEFTSQPEMSKLRLEISLSDGDMAAVKKYLPEGLAQMPRDVEFYEIATTVYKATGETRKADVAEQNMRQLEQLQEQLLEALARAGNNIDNVDARFEVATLYAKIGRYSDARRWFLTGANIDPERTNEAQQLMLEHLQMMAPLVQVEDNVPPQTTPAEEKNNDETKNETASQDAQPESPKDDEN
ncbi:MAG: tetratricopeptide repeat protein [Fuerstiella sp.]|nr:tetratricopeptide repeat protein [Fuerstiella sp.]